LWLPGSKLSFGVDYGHAVLTTTHAEIIIADNNLLTIEAAMELSCFLVVAAVAASYTLVAITHA